MARKHKVGKHRLDRYYHLAKEHGYRSRAAFKLLQLNRRHGFLGRASRGVVDLCAAPGGWMQVCRQHMPVAAPCIGVDLVPIAPIRNCTTIVADITSEKCVRLIRNALTSFGEVLDPSGRVATGDLGVDVVLSDASPNMGTAWLQDAYNQVELTLHALRIASTLLQRGGWFVSKLFRSADSEAFLLVARRLFQRVYVTKPPASRQQSAEIYVVCKSYLAPARLEANLFDPRQVFRESTSHANAVADVASPDDARQRQQLQSKDRKFRRQLLSGRRSAVPDDVEAINGTTKYRRCSLRTFLESSFPGIVLSTHNSIEIIEEDALPEPVRLLVNAEIRALCKDLGVCGPKDFRRLFKFWETSRRVLFCAEKSQKQAGSTVPESGVSEEPMVDRSAASSTMASTTGREKRLEAKAARERARKLERQRQRGAHLDANANVDEDTGFSNLFSLREARAAMQTGYFEEAETSALESSALDSEQDGADASEESGSDAAGAHSESFVDDQTMSSDDDGHDQDASVNLNMSADEPIQSDSDVDLDNEIQNAQQLVLEDDPNIPTQLKAGAQRWLHRLGIRSLDALQIPDAADLLQASVLEAENASMLTDAHLSDSSSSSSSSTSSSEPAEGHGYLGNTPAATHGQHQSTVTREDAISADAGTNTNKIRQLLGTMDERTRAELRTIARHYMLRRSGREALIDSTYHRHAFDDPESLPQWFLADEQRARKAPQIVDPAEVDAAIAQLGAPFEHLPKRVREARQRRQARLQRRLEAARERAEAIARAPEMNTASKIQQVARVMRRARAQRRQRPVLAVLQGNRAVPLAGGHQKPKSRGRVRYKLVDRRLKADLRGRRKARR
jgi:AdoMet-dependent rRNA methyltransferase SPB1